MKKNLIKKNHLIATNKYISKNSNFNFSGMLSIISLDSNYISKAAIESARKVLRRKLDKGKGSKLWILPNLKIKINKKSKGARMGKGIGKPKGYCYFIDKGCILFEIWNKTKINNNNLLYALNKLGLKCKLISKQILEKKYIKDSIK